jgi:DNA polymerase-3 subunit epsilon
MTWHTQPLRGFDLETTGVDVETARIVTAAIVDYGTPSDHARTWLANPGVEIPEEAAKIHGITTAHAKEHGRPAADVVEEIARALTAALEAGTPVVAMNARYDFTVLDRELRRHNLPTLEQRLGHPVGPVIDPFVIDKQADQYRKGSRKLEALVALYGGELTAAHTADADALAAVQVAVAIAEKYPQLQVDADRVHAWQIKWAADQAASFQAYKRRTQPGVVIDGSWPLVPFRDELTVAREELDAFRRVIVGHVAGALGRGEMHAWRFAYSITKDLDGAGANIDRAVDSRLRELGLDPSTAWLAPAEIVNDQPPAAVDLPQ